ncbi:MAG: hypothetical protein IAA97_05725 [Spirochaetes bacterium]|uniref:Fibronectin type-III domain-containing protein n=1 Tax=Candidatus Ornithospirochaeta stercoripullorum TaxID=2840899 RepID=A0A9D9DZP0_9SPIO|nr:hypothetical protein [Candidatus Ornithospirochaeta stercoripullorum]
MKTRKTVIAVLALLVMIALPLTAAEMVARWSWELDDPDVTVYRYQLDGEDPDGWTELSADTNYLEMTGLDSTKEYTLYLQRSYDGIHWSASAVCTAKASAEEQPNVRIYRYAGYEMKATIATGKTVLEYPAVSEDLVEEFFTLENERYGLGDLGVVYSIEDSDSAVLTYLETYTKEAVAAELDELVRDIPVFFS